MRNGDQSWKEEEKSKKAWFSSVVVPLFRILDNRRKGQSKGERKRLLIPIALAAVYMPPSASVLTAEVHSSRIPNLGRW